MIVIIKKYGFTFIPLLIGILFLTNTITAQDDREILVDLINEEQEAVNAIVLYPKETRMDILNASLYPDALIKMESIQSKTRTSFLELMEEYPQETQEEVWDLSRYPNLINTLVITPESDIDEVLEAYPTVIHKRAKKAVSENYDLLNRIDELDFIAKAAYESMINDYPEDAQNALNNLIDQPEVLTILMDNIRLTVLVGKVYEKDPEWLLHKADSLHLKIANDNARELDDWKKSLEDDPKSAEELQEVSEQYIEDQEYYDDDYYEYDRRDRRDNVTINYYYDYNYPYWFGYPTWYSYPRWRMYPYWYDWGFYYGPHNRIVILGLPSFHFTHWYFGRPHHHHHYNHLSAHFANHYYGHRNSTGSVTASVSNWREKNRDVVSERWIKDDGNLKSRFQEFGKAEEQRVSYNRKNPRKKLTQKEFIAQNQKKYPNLSESVKQVKKERLDIPKRTKITKSKKTQEKPIRTIPRKTRTDIQPTFPTKTNRRKPNIPQRREVEPKTRTIPTTKKARDYHKSTWDKTTTKRTKIKQPRTTVKKTPVIRKPTKKNAPVKKKGN